MPNLSAKRPIMTPPKEKPIIVAVNGIEASLRSKPNSVSIVGITTTVDQRPIPPTVLTISAASSLYHALELSTSWPTPLQTF